MEEKSKTKVGRILLWIFLFPIIATIFIIKRTNWKKVYKIISIILIWVLVLVIAIPTTSAQDDTKETTKIKEIVNFEKTNITGKVDEKITFSTYIEPSGIEKSDIELVVSDKNLQVEIQVSNFNQKTLVIIDIKSQKAGTYSLYLKSVENYIKSNTVYITINEKVDSTPTPPTTPSTPTTPNTPTNPSNPEDNSRVVYITPTGKKYHYSQSCAGKNASATTENKAKTAGKTGCKKCT